jgi:hypothetical protein
VFGAAGGVWRGVWPRWDLLTLASAAAVTAVGTVTEAASATGAVSVTGATDASVCGCWERGATTKCVLECWVGPVGVG